MTCQCLLAACDDALVLPVFSLSLATPGPFLILPSENFLPRPPSHLQMLLHSSQVLRAQYLEVSIQLRGKRALMDVVAGERVVVTRRCG
jgi:hypothetical protein